MAEIRSAGVILSGDPDPLHWSSSSACNHKTEINNRRVVPIHDVSVVSKLLHGHAAFAGGVSQVVTIYPTLPSGAATPEWFPLSKALNGGSSPSRIGTIKVEEVQVGAYFVDYTNMNPKKEEYIVTGYYISIPP